MAKRQKKLEPISIRLDADVRAALEAMAEAEERSMSQLINMAVKAYATERGYIEPQPAAGGKGRKA